MLHEMLLASYHFHADPAHTCLCNEYIKKIFTMNLMNRYYLPRLWTWAHEIVIIILVSAFPDIIHIVVPLIGS